MINNQAWLGRSGDFWLGFIVRLRRSGFSFTFAGLLLGQSLGLRIESVLK